MTARHYKWCPAKRGETCLCQITHAPRVGQEARLQHMQIPEEHLNDWRVRVVQVFKHTVMVSLPSGGFMHVMHGCLKFKKGEEPNVMDEYLEHAGG